MRSRKTLSKEDRLLWSQVAQSVVPLAGKKRPEPPESELPAVGTTASQGLPQLVAQAREKAAKLESRVQGLDRPTRKKLAKGRLPIDGKVDLHGMTQQTAHAVLLGFLHDAYRKGRRHVLVVTGKGSSLGSEGVLRRQVPAWLSTPAFRGIVAGHDSAARGHGGDGALYIRLRRRPEVAS